MKQMTEAELAALLTEAYDEGYSQAQADGPCYDPDSVDCVRDEFIQKLVESK